MKHRRNSSLASTGWLAEHLDDPGMVLLDATFKLPGAPTTGAQDYAAGHIPGATFFDIDAIADQSTDLPHMLPSPEEFARIVGNLGISNDTLVVAYDAPGLMSAGRVWWTFRIMGHERVIVLDGGLRKWRAEGRPVSTDVPARQPATFTPHFQPQMLRTRADMLANLQSRTEQVVDARPAGRFAGIDPEPRAGLRGGHIPGSASVPSSMLTDSDTGMIKPDAELRTLFQSAGVDLARPVATSCGSGVTAAALAFALHLTGKDDVAVYDGSWSEWGLPGDTPVEG
ncbi:MAG: 3-mercaptopyruvate sulfurtransferase [Devosia sp.]